MQALLPIRRHGNIRFHLSLWHPESREAVNILSTPRSFFAESSKSTFPKSEVSLCFHEVRRPDLLFWLPALASARSCDVPVRDSGTAGSSSTCHSSSSSSGGSGGGSSSVSSGSSSSSSPRHSGRSSRCSRDIRHRSVCSCSSSKQ